MALTVNNPKSVGVSIWFPSGNDLTYTMSSTQATQYNFYFKVDVYVNNAKVVTLRKYPIQNAASVNVRDIVNAYISSDFSIGYYIGLYDWNTAAKKEYAEFHITVTEVYGGDEWDSVTTASMYAWNAAAQFQDEKSGTQLYWRNFTFDHGRSRLGRPMGKHFAIDNTPFFVLPYLTDGYYLAPQYRTHCYHLARGDKRELSIFCGDDLSRNTELNSLVAYGMDENFKLIKKAVKLISTTANNADRHWVNFILSGGTESNWDRKYMAGQADAFTNMSDCKYIYYLFEKFDGSGLVVESRGSDGVLYEICDVPESWSVLYKSHEGGWSNIQCNRRTTERTEIKTITRQNVNPTAAYWASNARLITPVNVTARGSLTLNTDWIGEEINEDVKDMLQSPALYIQHFKDGNIEYTPVTLADATYTTRERNDVNLFNYAFDFIESFDKNTIRQ